MATKEEIRNELATIDARRKTLRDAEKDADSATTIALGKLTTYVNKSSALGKLLMAVGAPVAITDIDNVWVITTKGSGGGTKSTSRSRAANVSTWFVNGKDIESAMPSKVIKAIGADYGADSPERWLDKNVSKLAKVDAVVDGKRIKAVDFIKAHPAI